MHPRLWQNSHTRYECSLKAALPTIEGKGGGNKKCSWRWESDYDWG